MDVSLHPIVEQMSLSEQQREAVTVCDSDAVVTAGAGSGKTRTLVARYLSLLPDLSLPVRSIVAVTFTNRAAREMRNRVRREIGRYLSRQDLEDDERTLWENRYRDLDAARIGTIHSLCAEILRCHPAEARLDPNFEVLDESLAAALRETAVDETMAWAALDQPSESRPSVTALYPFLRIDGFRSLLSALLQRRLDAAAAFGLLSADSWTRLRQEAIHHLASFLDYPEVGSRFAALEAPLRDGTLERAEAAGDGMAPLLRDLLQTWRGIEKARSASDWATISLLTSRLQSCLKSKGRKAAWEPHPVKQVVSELRDLYRERLDWMPSGGVSLELDRQVSEMLPLLQRAFDQTCVVYQRAKARRRALDFDDLEAKALDLLHDPANSAVLSHWRQEIHALLVDEFQDTNDRQRKLFRLLGGEGQRLFLVGDPLQSIYRFRGTDVTVFGEEENRIRGEGGRICELLTSYRAHSALLDNINDLVRPTLPQEEDPQHPWKSPFRTLKPYREKPPAGLPRPHIELHLALGTKGSGALNRAASALTERLMELVDSQHPVLLEPHEGGSSPRPLGYGDVAILCRASSSFEAYENSLDRAGVPYVTVAGRGFYDRPVIRDLLNSLQALADPGDDLALAGMLRSPAFALSDAALFHLADWQQKRADEAHHVSLWHMLKQRADELPEPDDGRASRAIRFVERLRATLGRGTVAEILKDFLDLTCYRAILGRVGMSRAARNVSKLLADARASRMVSVGEFLEYIRTVRGTGVREGEARVAGAGAIQIMSVHAAKGLEFPVVALGDLSHGIGSRASTYLIDPRWGLLLRIDDGEGRRPLLYQSALAREQDVDDAESRRLLYVAATRARDLLLLNGCADVTKNGKLTLRGWLKWLGQEGCLGLAGVELQGAEDGSEPAQVPLTLGGKPVRFTVYPEQYAPQARSAPIAREEAVAGSPPPALLAHVSAEFEETAEDRWVEDFPLASGDTVVYARRPADLARAVGDLVHAALKHWYFPDQGFEAWAAAWLRRERSLNDRFIGTAVEDARRMLESFLEHPLYAEMNAGERLHEVPYSTEANGPAPERRIDALYQDDSGHWTLVEFKTTRIEEEGSLRRHLNSEEHEKARRQARRYAEAVEKLLGQRPKALVCLLSHAREPIVDEV